MGQEVARHRQGCGDRGSAAVWAGGFQGVDVMNTVRSQDGTTIAFDRLGIGPALILVDGALCHRKFGPSAALAKELSDRFTVFTYDRRGRGESSDTQPYSIEREVEDLKAIIAAAGGSAYVLGVSSGAALALEAANRRLPITK